MAHLFYFVLKGLLKASLKVGLLTTSQDLVTLTGKLRMLKFGKLVYLLFLHEECEKNDDHYYICTLNMKLPVGLAYQKDWKRRETTSQRQNLPTSHFKAPLNNI